MSISSIAEIDRVVRIDALLTRSAEGYPNRPALQHGRRTISYAELVRDVAATRRDLLDLGVRPGDRVLIVGANSVEEVTLLFALSGLAAWPILVSSRMAPAQLEGVVGHCDARLILFIGAPQQLQSPDAKHVQFTALEGVTGQRGRPASKPEPRAESPEDDVAAVIYTSGTTGTPKAAMLSHRNLVFIGLTQQQLRRYTNTDKTYCPLPLAHVGALGILMCLIAAGGCLFLAERFLPAGLAAAIRDDGVSVVPGLPPLHVKFLEWVAGHPEAFERGRVRLVTTSSSPLHEPVKHAVETLYGCPLQNAYGLTEASGVIFQVEADQWRDDTSVGPAIPGIDVRIAAADGRRAGNGERGEIQVRGPNVFLGYYKNAAATQAVFTEDGWLRTGDIAYLNDADVAFITGRAKETIKRSGYNIYPAEIEAALCEHPGVAMSAVVQGQRAADEEVTAFIQPERGFNIDAGALIDFLRPRVAPYELPGAVRLVTRLPTLTNGKIDKVTLRLWAAEASA